MVSIALIRPGSTTFDDEGRIKGCLDFPLSFSGEGQVQRCSEQLRQALPSDARGSKLDTIYCAPCDSARQTAAMIARDCGAKLRVVECFKNLDLGLWQGRTIDELRRLQPTVYRQFQTNPLTFCPPGGESMETAAGRIDRMLKKLLRRHRHKTVGIVVPEPLASLVRHLIDRSDIGDPWDAERDQASWEIISLSEPAAAIV